jgi:hypothetical protein
MSLLLGAAITTVVVAGALLNILLLDCSTTDNSS